MSQDWEQLYRHLTYEDAMVNLIARHRLIGEKRRSVAAKNYRLKMFLLIASAATTGAFWALLGGAFPVFMKWAGAVLSTIVTGVSAYQVTLGPAKLVEQLDELYSNFGRTLARARERPSSFSWHDFKDLQRAYLSNGIGEPTPQQIADARTTGMI